MDELVTTINGMLSDATAAGVAMAVVAITLAVIAVVRRKS